MLLAGHTHLMEIHQGVIKSSLIRLASPSLNSPTVDIAGHEFLHENSLGLAALGAFSQVCQIFYCTVK
jgi:hypothetical protein